MRALERRCQIFRPHRQRPLPQREHVVTDAFDEGQQSGDGKLAFAARQQVVHGRDRHFRLVHLRQRTVALRAFLIAELGAEHRSPRVARERITQAVACEHLLPEQLHQRAIDVAVIDVGPHRRVVLARQAVEQRQRVRLCQPARERIERGEALLHRVFGAARQQRGIDALAAGSSCRPRSAARRDRRDAAPRPRFGAGCRARAPESLRSARPSSARCRTRKKAALRSGRGSAVSIRSRCNAERARRSPRAPAPARRPRSSTQRTHDDARSARKVPRAGTPRAGRNAARRRPRSRATGACRRAPASARAHRARCSLRRQPR